VRDGFRCVVTKVYDSHSATANKELKEIVKSGHMPPAVTHCAHIFPESTNADIISGSDKVGFLPNVDVFVTDCFFYLGEVCCLSLGCS
jgi:hypothetical protein